MWLLVKKPSESLHPNPNNSLPALLLFRDDAISSDAIGKKMAVFAWQIANETSPS